MAGNTATIDRDRFSEDWRQYVTIADLCTRYTITKDQVIRLRDHFALDPRMDCSRRAKPKRAPKPTSIEVRRSEDSLELAPGVAAAAAAERLKWDEETELRREAEKHAGEQARAERRRFRFVVRLPEDVVGRGKCDQDETGAFTGASRDP
jgi:hypothetical protein